MGEKKVYHLCVTRNGNDKKVNGNLEYLNKYFNYTLEIGHSYDNTIKCNPKTIKSLLNDLEKTYELIENSQSRTNINLLY